MKAQTRSPPPPNQNLILPELVHGLLLVKPLQRSVVPLVKSPALLNRNPHAISLLKNVPQRAYRPLESARERDVRLKAFSLDELTGFDDLIVAFGGEGDVDPTGELVLEVPG